MVWLNRTLKQYKLINLPTFLKKLYATSIPFKNANYPPIETNRRNKFMQ